MLEVMRPIIEYFNEYVGTGSYMILFFLSLIYIYKKEKDSKIKEYMWFSIIMLIVIFNPIFYKVLVRFIGDGIYWRMFWCLPMGIIIAYVGTKVILEKNKIFEQLIIGVAIIAIIILSGKCVFNKDNFTLATNWYKLPQEALEITRMMTADKCEKKCALVPTDMVAYVRQYDSSIYMRYPRSPHSYKDDPIVQVMEEGNVERIISDSRWFGVTYIVLKKDAVLHGRMEDYNCYVLGETANYILYKLK